MEDKRIKNRHSMEERTETSTTTIEHWIWKISKGEDGFVGLSGNSSIERCQGWGWMHFEVIILKNLEFICAKCILRLWSRKSSIFFSFDEFWGYGPETAWNLFVLNVFWGYDLTKTWNIFFCQKIPETCIHKLTPPLRAIKTCLFSSSHTSHQHNRVSLLMDNEKW